MTGKITRRTFTQSTLAAGTLAALAPTARPAGANDRIRLGFIGVGNRGDQVLDGFLTHKDADVVALSDVYEPYLPAANKKAGGNCKVHHDYRRLLDQKDIDAVVVATPDHWHALMFVDACRAGKDVYCEKPLSLTIGEGRKMCDVARETGRVTQVGLHRRSAGYVREAVDLLRGGAIGHVTECKCYHLRNEFPLGIGKPPDSEPPAGLDWDRWLGPAARVAYNVNRCLYKFRWFWDYSGGQLTNFGTHYLDVIQWGLGQDAPRSVAAIGGKFAVDDNRDIPDTLEVVWQYDRCLVTFSQINANRSAGNKNGSEMEFRGTKGTMFLHEGRGWEILPEQVVLKELPALSPIARKENAAQSKSVQAVIKASASQGSVGTNPAHTAAHARNFLDCVKYRKPTNCPVEVGHRSTSATLLAKMAFLRGRTLAWDAKAERVTNDEEANRLLTYGYRQPWKLA
jgi:predicted dehydrogenase